MSCFLRSVSALSLTFSCLLTAYADNASVDVSMLCIQGMTGCGIAYDIPIEPTPTSMNTTTTYQTSYTIDNQSGNTVSIVLSLQELDSLGDTGAVTIDGSTTCPLDGDLDSDTSCNIVLDFQPSIPGDLNWTFTVTPDTAQLPLVLPLQATVVGSITYAAAGGYYSNDTYTYPLLAISADNGAWGYPIDDETSPLPYGLDIESTAPIVSVSCSLLGYCAGVGQYSYEGGDYPFATTNNGIDSWAYTFDYNSVQTLNTDDSFDYSTYGSFNIAYCSGDVCMLGGSYVNTSEYTYPMLVTSVSGGDWTIDVSSAQNLPEDITTSSTPYQGIFGLSGTGGNFVLSGWYTNTSSNALPLLAYSADNGGTWTYPSLSLPGDYVGHAELYESSCSGNICMSSGSYNNGISQLPLAYTSFDEGETWSLTFDSLSPAGLIPGDWNYGNDGDINSVSCNEFACAVSGGYYNGSPIPYLAVAVFSDEYPCTNSSNCNWVLGVDSTTNLPSDDANYAAFSDVACSQTTCVAVGAYHSSIDGNVYPLVGIYDLELGTVSYTLDQSSINATIDANDTPPDFYLSGHAHTTLTQVNCSLAFCVASGVYSSEEDSGTTTYPFVVTSRDSGHTWSYTIDGDPSTLPPSFVSGEFVSSDITPPTLKK